MPASDPPPSLARCGPLRLPPPLGQTGIAAALTNTTKTIGGSFASAIFAIVLVYAGASAVVETASRLAGYLAVFAICGAGALAAAVLLCFVPKLAFTDPAEPVADAEPMADAEPVADADLTCASAGSARP